MNGLLLINKLKDYTSRDIVNIVSKELNTKKVGHTGTLDPLATGLLILTIGNATKISELLTLEDKEYICTVKLGIKTDTLDITGKVLEEKEFVLDKEILINIMNSFIGKYNQQVPLYSAVKVKGRRLYDYARNNIEVELPSKEIEVKSIELLDFNEKEFKFKCLVSKGTYIRSLVRDIGDKLNIPMTMSDLIRTKQGKYKVEDSYTLENIKNKKYEIISMMNALSNYKQIEVGDNLLKEISNGKILKNSYDSNIVVFTKNNEVIAIYELYDKDKTKTKPKNVFLRGDQFEC